MCSFLFLRVRGLETLELICYNCNVISEFKNDFNILEEIIGKYKISKEEGENQ